MTAKDCDQLQLLIQAELDGELDAAEVATLLAHLDTCPGCTGFREELGQLSARLRGGLTRHTAPAALRSAVAAQLPAQAAVPTPRQPRWRGGSQAASFGAGLAVAAAAAWLIVLPARQDAFSDLVNAHIRALQPGHLMDVESTDQHTVKPWFDGRLDFAPSVPNLAAAGFPLIGGRLDYLDGHAVGALVYRRGKHLIDVFVRPGGHAGSAALQGYNVVGWDRDGMAYEAVSDLNTAELTDFAHLMRASP
jgi:anti-sigma factor RsiW